jgi:hypothetical protein
MNYFKVYELVDRATYQRLGDDAIKLFHPDILVALVDLHDFFGTKITVNNWYWHQDIPESEWEKRSVFQWRGYRTPEKAAALGAPQSAHAKAMAFDCDILGWTAINARIKIIANQDNPKLSRITRLEGAVSWVHFDIMPLQPGVRRIHVFHA